MNKLSLGYIRLNIFSAANQIAVSAQQQLAGMDQLAQATENIKLAASQNLERMRQAETAVRNLHELGQKPRTVGWSLPRLTAM